MNDSNCAGGGGGCFCQNRRTDESLGVDELPVTYVKLRNYQRARFHFRVSPHHGGLGATVQERERADTGKFGGAHWILVS